MKIWTVQHENLDRSSWKSWLFIIKILTGQHENLHRSLWRSWPFTMKIWTDQHENLDRSSWKSWAFNMKNLDRSSWKSRPFIMKTSTVCNEVSITRNKISTTRNKISIVINSTFGRNGATAQKVSGFGVILSRIFPAFSRIRTEYGDIRKMQENAGKMRTRITPNRATFYAVGSIKELLLHLLYCTFFSTCFYYVQNILTILFRIDSLNSTKAYLFVSRKIYGQRCNQEFCRKEEVP